MKFYTIFMGLFLCAPAQAYEWSDLWLNDYQKAQNLLADNPVEAADLFKDPGWQGIANYNAGDFQSAAEKFSESTGESAEYNLGNALAKAGKLEESLASYEKLLENPMLPKDLRGDASFNRDLVKKLMQEQEQQEQQSDQNSEESEESDSDKSENSQKSDQEGQQSQDQNDPEQSESGQEDQDQQEPSDDEQQAKDEQEGDKDESKETEQNKANRDQPMTEDQQATEQWLRQIPDDPSGLLRRKLIQSHRTKYPQVQNGGQAW